MLSIEGKLINKTLEDIEWLINMRGVVVHDVDFTTGVISVSFEDASDPQQIIEKIKFFNITEKIHIKRASLKTGVIQITISKFPKNNSLSLEEVELLKENKMVFAIKAVRERKGCSLADAKKLVDDYLYHYKK